MQDDVKNKQVEELVEYLKSIADNSIKNKCYEKAMASIASSAYVLYQFNQKYTDYELENYVEVIAQKIKVKYEERLQKYKPEDKTILFYDGFGLDTRGVALMYLSALKKNNYRIIYVTNKSSKGKQPEISRIMTDADIVWKYINMNKNYNFWITQLLEIIIQYSPKAMFYYTKPHDVSGAIGFCIMEKKTKRYLIDLTDHAFWLGVKSNDFFCGSREMSASNQYFGRNIPKEKMIKLGVNLIVDEKRSEKELPFDVLKERYIFSGGALYKTLGDKNNTYYKIVDHLLSTHIDLKFLYAGSGDETKIREILEKYPGRAFLIPEREDFYFLIKNCVFYLNTYPMFGGMMMKFSANAGKIPVTLKHNMDSDGLLLKQQQAKVEYDSYEELIEDADKLLCNEKYLRERENLLKNTVITEKRFINNLRSTIEEQKTDYQHEVLKLDTEKFQKEFYDRFNLENVKSELVIWLNRSLFFNMPEMIIIGIKKVCKKLIHLFR